jgi:hypothetical protein
MASILPQSGETPCGTMTGKELKKLQRNARKF